MTNKIAILTSIYSQTKLKEFEQSISNIDFEICDVFLYIDGVINNNLENLILNYFNTKRIFKIIRENENKGLAYGLNKLINIALKMGYCFLARVDTDDICVAERFNLQRNFLIENKSIDIVGSYVEEFGKLHGIVKYPLTHIEMINFFPKRNPLAHTSVMFKNTYFIKAGLYPLNTLRDEDTYFWIKGFQNGCIFSNIPKVMVRVRIDDEFFKRRKTFEKIRADFFTRIYVISVLKLSKLNYIYSLLFFIFNLTPNFLYFQIYKHLKYK